MIHFNSVKVSNNIDDDIIITIEEDYTSTSSINEKLGVIPVFIGVATYSIIGGLPNINWSSSNSYSLSITINGVEVNLIELTDSTPTVFVPTPGTYTAIAGDSGKKFLCVANSTAININAFSNGNYCWVYNNKDEYQTPVTLYYANGAYSYVVNFGETVQFAVIGGADYVFAFNYTEINVADSDFLCKQPDFLNGVYNGSNYVLINATELPNGLKVYLNTGEFGYVKDAKCLIKLDKPLETGDVIYCFVDTNNCNVQSCEYVVGEFVSGEIGCIDASDIVPAGTLTGGFICIDYDLYREEFNEYGQKVAGVIVQENCYLCGGTEPSCV